MSVAANSEQPDLVTYRFDVNLTIGHGDKPQRFKPLSVSTQLAFDSVGISTDQVAEALGPILARAVTEALKPALASPANYLVDV